MGEHNRPRSEGPSGKAKLMAAEILADWGNGMVLIQEKSQAGIQLVQPMVFAIPMATFMATAFTLGLEQLKREKQDKVKTGSPIIDTSGLPHRQ